MEIWKDLPGYEGKYQVSDQGRVRSMDREVICKSRDCKSYTKRLKGKLLTPRKGDDQGHLTVRLCNPRSRPFVHQLVLLTFNGPSKGRICRHLDSDISNNTLANLAFGTRRENSIDFVLCGNRRGLLNLDQVREIKLRLLLGYSLAEISKALNIEKYTIRRIRAGKIYAYLDY
jgi:hypothetical protein